VVGFEHPAPRDFARFDAFGALAGDDSPFPGRGARLSVSNELEELREILNSPWKRLCNLYWQVDKHGRRFKFKPNPVQTKLYWDLWYLNVILKARQEGVTTLVQLWMLDRCLFNPDTRAGVIAHNRDDAENFFKNKLKYAYDNLPEAIRAEIPARIDRAGELAFANGSSIRVGTSMRSDTLQYLHVSEFGKICAKYPDKAAEIVSGSLNTVVPGQFVVIESTAEGAYGKFYDMCQTAEKKLLSGVPLTKMDYRFHFFPWWMDASYRLETDVPVEVPRETAEYFKELEEKHGIVLDQAQKNWYVKKEEEQGDHMGKEYPSVPEDAFRAVVEGAVFGKQMREARRKRRVLPTLPYVPGIPVNTFWDLGRSDLMSIWFHQRVGPENRFIDYLEDSGHNLQHYVRVLMNEKPYTYGRHYLPHDIEVTDLTQTENLTRRQVLERAGLRNIVTVKRISEKEEAHELARQALATCWFAEDACSDGVKALENYRYEWDEKRQQYSKTPIENRFCHGADAFMQFAQAYTPNAPSPVAKHVGMY
jgi:hypothetical protein